jgi:hypothetical protein
MWFKGEAFFTEKGRCASTHQVNYLYFLQYSNKDILINVSKNV